MTFNSMQFVVFLLVVLGVYWQLSHKLQNRFLLVASYVFYGWWDWRFLGLLLGSTLVDYWVGQRLGKIDAPDRRKRFLLASMAVNLGFLGFFKYFGFFVDSLDASLAAAGVSWLAPSLGIVLPVGISFYTFQSMSYTIDVYRRELKPVDDLFDFALYVSFFPQLVAGPIERATRLMPQVLAERTPPDGERVLSALSLILVGLVKKVVVADTAARVANAAFNDAGSAGFLTLIVGVYCFALQIYGDFSGYSDMARGTARLLGFELMENFAQPYFSLSITEFWQRWHISLSQWLRDYLYIPLGGNRRGPRRTYINLGLTMLLGGLWHGAAWTFVVWGALQGLYLMIERRFGFDKIGLGSTGKRFLRGAITFHLTCFAWIFFRAATFGEAADVIMGILTLRPGTLPIESTLNVLLPSALIALLFDAAQRRTNTDSGLVAFRPAAQGLVFGLGAVLVLLASGGQQVPFVYFQF